MRSTSTSTSGKPHKPPCTQHNSKHSRYANLDLCHVTNLELICGRVGANALDITAGIRELARPPITSSLAFDCVDVIRWNISGGHARVALGWRHTVRHAIHNHTIRHAWHHVVADKHLPCGHVVRNHGTCHGRLYESHALRTLLSIGSPRRLRSVNILADRGANWAGHFRALLVVAQKAASMHAAREATIIIVTADKVIPKGAAYGAHVSMGTVRRLALRTMSQEE